MGQLVKIFSGQVEVIPVKQLKKIIRRYLQSDGPILFEVLRSGQALDINGKIQLALLVTTGCDSHHMSCVIE